MIEPFSGASVSDFPKNMCKIIFGNIVTNIVSETTQLGGGIVEQSEGKASESE